MMRKAKKLILTCLMPILVLAANAQTKKPYDWTKIMNAIIQVESKGNTNTRSKDCVGILQIRPILVKDVNEYLEMKGSIKRFEMNDRLNAEKSKEMFILYQERYNPKNNIEKAIRLWNGGCGYSKVKTENYYHKVMKYYNGS